MYANLVHLFIFILFCCNFNIVGFAQEDIPQLESNDPIRESIAKRSQKFEGVQLTEKEYNYLIKINEKYKLNERDRKIRRSLKDTLNIIEKFKLARTYRKEYLLVKNVEEFRKNKIESIQSQETLKRMRESKKRANARYKKRKWQARKKKFLNLFK